MEAWEYYQCSTQQGPVGEYTVRIIETEEAVQETKSWVSIILMQGTTL